MRSLEDEWRRLAAVFRGFFSTHNGLVPAVIHAESGAILDRRAIVDELGDYLPYLLYGGSLFGDSSFVASCHAHLARVRELCETQYGLLDTRITIDAQKPRYAPPLYSIHNADTINGLVAAYLLTKDGEIRGMVERFFSGLERFFMQRGLVSYGRAHGVTLPIANTLFAAYAAEELVNLSDVLGGRYLSLARSLLAPYLSSEYFLRHGLFPSRVYMDTLAGFLFEPLFSLRNRPRSRSSVIVKDNCYFVFALHAVALRTREQAYTEAVARWFEAFRRLVYKGRGAFYNHWSPRRGSSGLSDLQRSHSIVELALDLHGASDKGGYLSLAEEIAGYWLERRGRTGLLRAGEGGNEAPLDPNVDWMVNFFKLTELTGNREYEEAGWIILSAILRYYRAPHGYAWSVDADTGSMRDCEVETKYLGLAMKGLLVAAAKGEMRPILKDPLLRFIARDR